MLSCYSFYCQNELEASSQQSAKEVSSQRFFQNISESSQQ